MGYGVNTSRNVYSQFVRREDWPIKLEGTSGNGLQVSLGGQHVNTALGTNGLTDNGVGDWTIHLKDSFTDAQVFLCARQGSNISGPTATVTITAGATPSIRIKNFNYSGSAAEIGDGEIIDLKIEANRSSVARF